MLLLPSLPSTLVPPHLGPGRPREPQGAVAALPQEKPLPGRGGPCLPLLVSIGDTATWVTPPGTVPCHLLLFQLAFWELLALLVPALTHPSHLQVQEALLSGAHLHGAACQGGGGGGSASSSCSGADVRLAAVGSEGGPGEDRDPPGAETELAAALGGWWLDVNSHFRPQNEIWGCLQPPVTISLSLTQGQGASP